MIIEEIITQSIQNTELIGRTLNSPKSKNTKHFLIIDNDIEVAFLSLDIIPNVDYLVLYEIYIIKEKRNKGYGTQLLHHIEKFGSEIGYNKIVVYPEPLEKQISKNRLINFYHRAGFTERKECIGEYVKKITQ